LNAVDQHTATAERGVDRIRPATGERRELERVDPEHVDRSSAFGGDADGSPEVVDGGEVTLLCS
jgi:hypothetical protein